MVACKEATIRNQYATNMRIHKHIGFRANYKEQRGWGANVKVTCVLPQPYSDQPSGGFKVVSETPTISFAWGTKSQSSTHNSSDHSLRTALAVNFAAGSVGRKPCLHKLQENLILAGSPRQRDKARKLSRFRRALRSEGRCDSCYGLADCNLRQSISK